MSLIYVSLAGKIITGGFKDTRPLNWNRVSPIEMNFSGKGSLS